VLFGIALIPLIYAGALTWASQDPIHRLEKIPAAIVNEDHAATADGETVNVGAELVDELTSDDSPTNFHWVELDADDADAQLASGDILAVLTVPAGFSRDALSVTGDNPRAAELAIRTNDGANQIVGNIASTIASSVTATLSTSVSSTYLQNVYLGISDIHDEVSTAASGAATVSTGAADAASGSRSLVAGLADLSTGGARLSSGASAVQSAATQAVTGASQVSDGSTALATGSGTALSGAQALAAGANQASSSASSLAAGTAGVAQALADLQAAYPTLTDAERLAAIGQLVDTSGELAGGAGGLSSGVHTIASSATALVGDASAGTGLAALSAGATALSAGAGTLDSGLAALSSGASDLASGASTLSRGIDSAATGASELDSGLQTLRSGASELADGLESGAASIPTYSTSGAHDLSGVVADPIHLTASRDNEVPWTGYSLAPYFMTLSLWVGALAFYLMFPALRERLLVARKPSWLIAIRSYLPGAAMALTQSLLVVLIVRLGIGIEPANLAGLAGIVALTSLTFVAINQALIAILGPIGRFVALVLVVLQLASAGATYPIQTTPEVFQAIHFWLPFTYSVEAFRSLIAGGSIGIAQAVPVLLVWMLSALVVTALAARRTRGAQPGMVIPRPIAG
jgi:putative membrane protein